MNIRYLFIAMIFLPATSFAVEESSSVAKVFNDPGNGIIELTGSTAKYLYERLSKVEEKGSAGESERVGTGIRCAKYEFPKFNNGLKTPEFLSKEKAKAIPQYYSYKCFFQIGVHGEISAPTELR